MIVQPLEAVVAATFGGPTPGAFGVGGTRPDITAAEIATAESTLGGELPEALKDYYTVAGRYDGMMAAHSRFLAPAELQVNDGHVVFCHENQHVMEWGVQTSDLGLPNPAVYGQMTSGPDAGKWFLESATVSAFLLGFGSWQAVLSSDESAECELPEDIQPKLTKWFDPVGETEVREGGPLIGYVNRKRHLIAAHDIKHGMLYVGTSVEDGLEKFENRSHLDLNWY